MSKVVEGSFTTPLGRFALVAARFNQLIVENLVNGAIDGLARHGVVNEDIDLFWVPGAFDIPLIAQKLAARAKYSAVICLGAVIRGETGHYDHVATCSVNGIAQVAMATSTPVISGILTCDTLEQALDRAGAKSGNKGFDAARAAIEMVNLISEIDRMD